MPEGRWTQTKPCESCPYRRDTPVGIWSAEEYATLQAEDRREFGATYGCHLNASRAAEDAQPCAGWLADQKRRGVPSIRLRVVLMTTPAAREAFGRVDEKDPGLYASIEEMVRANAGRRFPARAKKAVRLLVKVGHDERRGRR